MSTATQATRSVDALMAELDRAWRRSGVPRRDRVAMAADVALDLRAAAADGLDPRSLLAPDVEGFAAQVAEARDVVRSEPAYARVLLGGMGGACSVFFIVARSSSQLHEFLVDQVELRDRPSLDVAVAAFGALGLACIVGSVFGLAVTLDGRGRAGATVWRAAVLLPVVPAVMVPLVLQVGRAVHPYGYWLGVLAVAVLLTFGGSAWALVIARRWALRQ